MCWLAVSIPDGDSFRREVKVQEHELIASAVSIPDGDSFRREATTETDDASAKQRFQSPMGIVSAAKPRLKPRRSLRRLVSIPDGDSFRREAYIHRGRDGACACFNPRWG